MITNRQIEFRVWDTLQNKFILWDQHIFISPNESGYTLVTSNPNHLLTEFTGYRDVKGNKIFSGDIVLDTNVTHEILTYVIKFEDGGFVYWWPPDEIIDCFDPEDSIEVIGNIFETPNLLDDDYPEGPFEIDFNV